MIAYLDCFSGASGDMILAALIDAGADLAAVETQLTALGIPFELTFTTVHRCGLRACKVDISAPDGTWTVMRTYADGLRLVEGGALDPEVAARAASILGRLARAEAKVHGTAVGDVHFHELDGVDTIVDVVGSAAAFASLGAGQVFASPVATGTGVVPSRHGPLPLPAPAVLELLGGASIYGRTVEAELITPTGAAILAEYAESFGKMPEMTVSSVGYGAGSRELEIPNVIRVVLGEPTGDSAVDRAEGIEDLMVEATLDDMNPELYPYVLERLTVAGATDAWVVPVIGKSGRPAQVIQVLAPPHAEEAVRDTLIAETSTIGVRVSAVRRWMLPRRWLEVDVDGVPVRVKIAYRDEVAVNVAPEYADCAAAARTLGMPLKEVYRAALSAAAQALAAQ
ncbi:MAG: pyridinium-3,5-bisthiocarboxylic acid mononucleotide nickel chelatase [Actinomycetota bacterium]|nr:pyridinium-3,5-bisthiocarboxylic acid mononucleotide nickel chelatase [Actinomycetota bacterium]